MSVINLKKYLEDFNIDDTEKAEILKYQCEGNTQGIIRMLRKHRQDLLSTIHKEEKQISCLDYLVFQLEKEV